MPTIRNRNSAVYKRHKAKLNSPKMTMGSVKSGMSKVAGAVKSGITRLATAPARMKLGNKKTDEALRELFPKKTK